MSDTNTPSDYAGDLTPEEAWALCQAEPSAQIVDVRTAAEWNFVGLPDLSSLNRTVHCVEWQRFPTMAANPGFVAEARAQIEKAGADKTAPVLFLCRSGARSRAAAIAMTRAGFKRAYNISSGFEGDLDGQRHRGGTNGWKASGLPWRQG